MQSSDAGRGAVCQKQAEGRAYGAQASVASPASDAANRTLPRDMSQPPGKLGRHVTVRGPHETCRRYLTTSVCRSVV